MLSVVKREDWRKGIGFGGGGMEVDNELEEGEACSDQEDDSCVDPDALSYIDKKIQDVLGHFRKDFEEEYSAENLGAKFGGYGSFLPTYQRSSCTVPQPRSPQKVTNKDVAKSPYNPSVEVTNPNPLVSMSSSYTKTNGATVPTLDNLSKRDMCKNESNIQDPSSQHTLMNRPTSGTDNKTLKLRIKVGSDNTFARNNAAIYSGLGLDISPSSSFEDSPNGSGGVSPEFQEPPHESPKTIVQIMTSFNVPGVFLLSPLQNGLIQLAGKVSSFVKNKKRGMIFKGMPETSSDFVDITVYSGEAGGQTEKKRKSSEEKGKQRALRKLEGKHDVFMSREIDIETEGQELASNLLNLPPFFVSLDEDKKADKQTVVNSTKIDAKMDHIKEMKKASLKDKYAFPGPMNDKPFELIVTPSNGVGNSGNETLHSRRKLKSKSSIPEKLLKERKTNNQKDKKSELQRESISKVEKDFDITSSHLSGCKRKNKQMGQHDYCKLISSPCNCNERLLEENDQISDRKKKLKVSQTNTKSSGKFSKVSIRISSSATLKENKKNVHAKAGHAAKKTKVPKMPIDLSGAAYNESHGNANWIVKSEKLESRVCSVDFHSQDRQKTMKLKNEKEPIVSTQAINGRLGIKKVEKTPIEGVFVSEPNPQAPVTCNVPAMGGTVVPQAPLVIEDWVACDICQTWRLLPLGTNSKDLPQKWQCTMLSWLPGMNRCDISEDETTNALRALYLAPAPESFPTLDDHHVVAASSASLTGEVHLGQHLDGKIQNAHGIQKKKSTLKDSFNKTNHSGSTHFPNSVKKGPQIDAKGGNTNGSNHPLQINSTNRGIFSDASRSTDFNAGKQKYKLKSHGFYSDGGDSCEQSEKHSKLKIKRVVDEYEPEESKKPKKEVVQYPGNDASDHDVVLRDFKESTIDGFSTKEIAYNQPKPNKLPPLKHLKCNSSSSSKKLDEVQFRAGGETKESFHRSDVDKLSNVDFCAKKRKVKGQVNKHNQGALLASQPGTENGFVREAPNETEPVKDRKAEISISDGKMSQATKLNNRMGKRGNFTRMALPAGGARPADGMDEAPLCLVDKDRQFSQIQGNKVSLRETDFDTFKRDTIYAQPPAAANSSSSKVSGSRKSRSNFLDTKGSPVESVSSSPLRVQSNGKLSHKKFSCRNVDVTNADPSVFQNLKRCSENEVNGGSKDEIIDFDKVNWPHLLNDSRQRKSGKKSLGFKEKNRGQKPDMVKSKLRVSGSDDDSNNLQSIKNGSNCRFEVGFASHESEKGNFPEKDEKVYLEKTSRQNNCLALPVHVNMDVNHPSTISNQQRVSNSTLPVLGMGCAKPDSHVSSSSNEEKVLDYPYLDKADCSELPSSLGRLESKMSSRYTQETKSQDLHMVSLPLKASEPNAKAVGSVSVDALKMVKHYRKPDNRNGLNHSNTRYATSSGLENHSAVLKEARGLKHKAKHLKSEGLELESTGLNFESALKFLHVASLMEPTNFDSSKQVEAAQMYFETAKFCEFVAHDCENLKNMAAAALAYKCAEVAYMKSAYCKNPNASKDRHELQVALQFLPPGESPSSSASDVDNLNNHATLVKNASSKDGNSQVACSHATAARYHHQLMRLLHYTDDLNSAFEATEKSQSAIAAASVNMEKDRIEAISSVKKALNFSFHNIEAVVSDIIRIKLSAKGSEIWGGFFTIEARMSVVLPLMLTLGIGLPIRFILSSVFDTVPKDGNAGSNAAAH
ncbi:hypothetical protein Cni_G15472 [Canna indica]|uniref:CW-type domain-containing protein n=1 Tax=Canna indica TaxID=4628 RepID=A0AAQ3KDN5_9LILI|nr:hypothetical protein Cni_G15472 [Canna indica]